jgi:hypothetical protein
VGQQVSWHFFVIPCHSPQQGFFQAHMFETDDDHRSSDDMMCHLWLLRVESSHISSMALALASLLLRAGIIHANHVTHRREHQ